jgi:ABC-type branched-subunit amino acid transport system substrate-binding protein
MTIHVRVILYIIGIYTLLYFIYGFQESNFYSRITSGRAQMASADRGDIQIGVLYSKNENSAPFVSGVDMAIEEINNTPNETGARGILFLLPDGKNVISRKLKPAYLPLRDSKALTIVSPLVSELKWKKHLVAIVSSLTTSMTQRTRVIPEYYGIATISVRPTLTSLSQEDFKYFVRTVPSYHFIARYLMEDLLLTIARRSGKKIEKIGIFFNTDSPEGYLEELISARNDVNQKLRVIEKLRAGFDSGLLNELNDMKDMVGSEFLQVAVDLDRIQIDQFIDNNLTKEDMEKSMSLKAIVDHEDPLETPTELVFTIPFLPETKDYRPLITMAEEKEPDLIIISSGIPESLKLIRQMREMGLKSPIMVTRINEYEQLLQIPTDRLTDVYGAAMYDPASQDYRFTSFKERYERFLKNNNKPVSEPDFLSLQGYEAVYLIARAIAGSNSTIPMNIINSLKYPMTPLEGQVFEHYEFDAGGDVLNRKLYNLFFNKGTMSVIKEQE